MTVELDIFDTSTIEEKKDIAKEMVLGGISYYSDQLQVRGYSVTNCSHSSSSVFDDILALHAKEEYPDSGMYCAVEDFIWLVMDGQYSHMELMGLKETYEEIMGLEPCDEYVPPWYLRLSWWSEELMSKELAEYEE